MQVDRLLELVRAELGMDAALIGRIHAGCRTVAYAAGAGIAQGVVEPLEATYCGLISNGTLQPVVPDTGAVPEVADLPITARLGIASHVGVPLTLSDGSLYGTLCAYSSHVRHDLSAADVRLCRLVGRLVAERLEADIAEERRLAAMTVNVRAALSSGDPMTMVQPIVNLETREPIGFEVLSRFMSAPHRTPDAWFADAATVGLGIDLELQALRNGLAATRSLPAECYLSLNASTALTADGGLVKLIEGAGGRPLVIEITEHSQDEVWLRPAIDRLRDLGCRVAVDDVGAGYSGISRLLALLPDIVKLDRNVVADVDRDVARQALVAAAVSYCDATGVQLIAEGVETETEAAALASLGINFIQGFLTGPPRRPEAPT
ncbi:MAG: diguanylate cyclase/phosphodiesterase with sensor [Actinomycetia bacterium]|nr:diguanylate cyclase/phosphodiesterase with sensor [Actinomycetes bacterium]